MTTSQSWGNYPAFPQTLHTPYWRGDLAEQLEQLKLTHGSILPFGNGRSYGDSCLAVSDHVLHLRGLDRFISVNWQLGIITAEAGVSFEEIIKLAIPNGWFLPVTPGTKFLTLGGAIANDVHGKNHHVRGTIGSHVLSFSLIRSDQPPMICSLTQNAELFAATIGGLGLTGIIEWVELQLMPIQSSWIETRTIRFDSISEFFSLAAELDHCHEYTVAWVDCLAKGQAIGRGVFIAGNHAATGGLNVSTKRRLNVPFTLPVSMFNKWTLSALNSCYFSLHKRGAQLSRENYDSFFYPLDCLKNWNRIYGPKGFQQYQCVIPDSFAEETIQDILAAISARGSGSCLAVMKRYGQNRSPGLLSFPRQGVSLALDFSQQNYLNSDLFPRLDALVVAAGGRLYPAKDAHMTGKDFRIFYPAWETLECLRDPALCSRFWRRIITS